MKEFNYSFIIPHKNCPELLQKCVDSIPKRDDVQIIVVDDNSDEGKKPEMQRSDVEVVYLDQNQSNGAGKARNEGLIRAKGKWILFADADDYFSDKIYNLLDKFAKDDITDMVILNAQMTDENGKKSKLRVSLYIDNYLNKRFYSEMVLRYNLWTPWSRMVKRSLIREHNIFFEEVPTGNDMMFCLFCSKYAKVIMVEKEIIYNYLKPNGRSLTNSLSKEYNSIEPKILRTFRRLELYKDVNYIFEPEHIRARYYASRIDKSYLRHYNEILKKFSYSNSRDLYNFILSILGQIFRII